MMKGLMDAVHGPLCNMPALYNNTTFQLFGADVAPDENLDVKLIEINKGPDMGAKDTRDKNLKKQLQEDIFELLGVIKTNRKNDFELVWQLDQ